MNLDRTTLRTIVACVLLSAVVLVALLATTGGRFALPLDDPYIYLQYAKQAAGGAFFRYTDAAPPTTGATSLLYLLVLTPLAVLLHGTALAVGAFVLGTILLAATALGVHRLARTWVGEWAGGPAVALLLLTGPLIWGSLSGMETALVAAIVTWSLVAVDTWSLVAADRTSSGRSTGRTTPELGVAIATGLLCLARPEAAVLVVGFVLLAALVGRRPLPLGPAPTAIVLAAAATPFILNLLLTGSPGSMTLASKGAPYLPGTTLITWAIDASQFLMHNLKGLIGGGDANAAAWPSAYTTLVTFLAPLTLPLLVLGAFPALVVEMRTRRPGVASLGTLLLFGSLVLWAALVPLNLHWSRYVIPFLPIVTIFTLAGVGRVATLFGENELDVRRGILTFLLAASAPTLVFFVAIYAWNGREIAEQHIAMARWIREETPPGGWVGTNDVGAIAYYGERPVLDLHGLVSRDLAEAKQVGSGAILEHLERLPAARRPTTLVVIPGWFDPNFLRIHRPVRSQTLYKPSIAGSPLVAYRAGWSYVGSADRPGPETLAALADRRLVDALDVADLADEKAHGYELKLLPGASASPVGLLAPPGRDQPVPDGARLVTGSERFDLALAPGHDAVLVVRTLNAIRATVGTADVAGAPIAARGAGDETWTETLIPIPAAWIRQSPTRIVVTAEDGALQEGGYVSAHWWAFQ